MFKTLKELFSNKPARAVEAFIWGVPASRLDDSLEIDYYTATKAKIQDGKLYSPTGEFVGSYSRDRDARRGAERRGWKV